MDGNFFFVNYFFYRGRSGGTYSDFVRETPFLGAVKNQKLLAFAKNIVKFAPDPLALGGDPLSM